MQHAALSCLLMLSIASAFPATPAYARQNAAKRPNIVFIMTDDHASHAISAYGSRINTTPNLDRLAADGMLFRNCFVTNSICGPCRAVILSGRFSHLNGVVQNGVAFDQSQITLPKLFQAAGYQTAMIGKWHLLTDPVGFDHWEILYGQGPYYNPPMKTPDGRVEHTGYTTDIITDLALQWLDGERDEDKPFLLMVQHKAPHRNWQPGPGHLNLYDEVTIPEPQTLFDDYATRAQGARTQEMTVAEHLNRNDLKLVPPGNLTPAQLKAWNDAYDPKNAAFEELNPQGRDLVRWKYQRYMKDYLRTIASVDDNIGRLLDALEEAGLADNTLVIYTSDQGFYLGDHGWYDKRWMYEQSLRTPLIVRWPGRITAGSTTGLMAQNVDFTPTMLHAAGIEVPDSLQGRSLVPVLTGELSEPWRDAIYYHYYEFPGVHAVPRHYGVRTDRYKLIHYYQLGAWELFDLADDPNELNNVIDDSSYAAIRTQLETRLRELQAEYQDPIEAEIAAEKDHPQE